MAKSTAQDDCLITPESLSVDEFRAIAAFEGWSQDVVDSMLRKPICTVPFFIGFKNRRKFVQLIPDKAIVPIRR